MKSLALFCILSLIAAGCSPGAIQRRAIGMSQSVIIIAGQRIPINAKVVLWSDPSGFNGYDNGGVQTFAERDRIRPGAWDLKMLQETIDQFVIHYDGSGSSGTCFETLRKRQLSVHFMVDTDGTIYQLLDVKERAWHATRANSRSVGVEMANIGAYPPAQTDRLEEWYGAHSVQPARSGMVSGKIQGENYVMYDFTTAQYHSLMQLTATLCTALPRIACDYPRESDGGVIKHVLTEPQFQAHHGLIGHYHIQAEKQDPGPAFEWKKVVQGARQIMQSAR